MLQGNFHEFYFFPALVVCGRVIRPPYQITLAALIVLVPNSTGTDRDGSAVGTELISCGDGPGGGLGCSNTDNKMLTISKIR